MGIYLKMALAYLKRNKLRTILLILGVALGVVLIFGTSVIKESQNKNTVKAIHKIYGGYHAQFSNLNAEDTKKLKNEKDVSNITTVQNLGNLVDEKGNSFPLKSADKNYITKKSGKLVEGRLPNNNNEIVMKKEALEDMNISDKLNSTLKFTVKKKYTDSKGNSQVHTENKEFKLVGIIKKPKGFYDFFDIYFPFEALTYGNSEPNNLIPQDNITYDSLLSLKSGWQNIDKQAYSIVGKNNFSEDTYTPNMPLVRQLMDTKIEKDDPSNYKKEALIIITSAIFVFNIFNITLNETIKETGLLRLIGSSKKGVRAMVLYQALIIMILGIIVGLILGTIFSYIGINIFKPYIYEEAMINPKLYVSKENIIKAIITGVISILVSCIIPIIKVGKISGIEATKSSEKFKGHIGSYKISKLFNKIFGFYGFMGLRNIGRNKGRAFISMLSIALGGYVFLTTFTSMENEISEKIKDMHERYDISIEFGPNTDTEVANYSERDIKKIKNIDGVKSVNTIQADKGLFDFENYTVDKGFKMLSGIKDKEQMKHEMDLKFYGNDYINKNMKEFLEDGSLNDIGKVTNGYPNVAVYNYFYDKSDKKVFTDLKVGDILNLKVPITANGENTYKESQVRVAATLKPNWMAMGDGDLGRNFEIVTSNNHAIDITGKQKYTKLGINLEDPNDKAVSDKVEEVSSSIHLSKIKSKLAFDKMQSDGRKEFIKSQIATISLVLIIAGINIFCTIRTNLLIRKKEISTLRSIGLSIRNMKKMVIYEALSYAILSFLIALIPATMKLIKYANWNNDAYKNYGVDNFMSFTFPFKESIIFLILSITVCLVAVVTSNRDFKNMNIIEGIKDKG